MCDDPAPPPQLAWSQTPNPSDFHPIRFTFSARWCNITTVQILGAGQVLERKTMRIVYENVISQPPEIVFPWIAEPEKAMKWQKNFKGGEIIIRKPEVIGTTFKELIEEDGKSLEMDGIITKYINNEMVGFHLESKIHEFDVSYSLEEIDRKIKLSIEGIIRWKFPMNILCLFIGKQMEKNLVKQLESDTLDLKKICETG